MLRVGHQLRLRREKEKEGRGQSQETSSALILTDRFERTSFEVRVACVCVTCIYVAYIHERNYFARPR